MKVSEEFYNVMEDYRKRLCKKGIKQPTQAQVSSMIAQNLKRKRRGLGMLK